MMAFLNVLPKTVAQGILWGIMAIGVYITFRILDYADMTVDGSICTGMAVCALMSNAGLPIWLAILCATLAGMAAGFLTGVFHSVFGIPAILSGILTQMILWSVNLKLAGAFLFVKKDYAFMSANQIGTTLLFLAIFVVLLIVVLYRFFGTELGASIRATGTNPRMSCAQGINVNSMKILGLVISNGIVALSGSLFALYNGSYGVDYGRGAIVTGLAAVIIADALFSWTAKLKFAFALKLLTIIGGGIIYYLVYQMVLMIVFDANLLKMLSAIIVAIFLAFPHLKNKYFKKFFKGKKGGKKNA
jgi:putative ABC transport system permease protein